MEFFSTFVLNSRFYDGTDSRGRPRTFLIVSLLPFQFLFLLIYQPREREREREGECDNVRGERYFYLWERCGRRRRPWNRFEIVFMATLFIFTQVRQVFTFIER